MAENSGKAATGRPFEKGLSGNPGGRPKKSQEIIDALSPHSKTFTKNLIKLANGEIDGQKPSDMHKAIELGLAYIYGKPVQTIAGDNENPLGVIITAPGQFKTAEEWEAAEK